MTKIYDVCVVGGGSGGIGAALGAANAGSDVVLVESQAQFGGTSTCAYVSAWGPGPGDSIAQAIYERLSATSHMAGVAKDCNLDRSKGPFSLWYVDEDLSYQQTLCRFRIPKEEIYYAVFDPDEFSNLVAQMFEDTGRITAHLNTRCIDVSTDEGKQNVISVKVHPGDGEAYQIRAQVFIDCTGGVKVCRKAGCETEISEELNAVSLCYHIRKNKNPATPHKDSSTGWEKSAQVIEFHDKDVLLVNPLALIPGREFIGLKPDVRWSECRDRVDAHWYWLRRSGEMFSEYEFDSYAPMIGVRESYRVIGEYVLTEDDLYVNLKEQDDVITLADHPVDLQGATLPSGDEPRSVRAPYGVPYKCLIPLGWKNLLVACRGASFDHVAASSCRLSRTMMALGHAAGRAATMAASAGCAVGDIDVKALQEQLAMPQAIKTYTECSCSEIQDGCTGS